jgi:hypothetical protein
MEQFLSVPGFLTASMARIADVVRSIVVVALNYFGILHGENKLALRCELPVSRLISQPNRDSAPGTARALTDRHRLMRELGTAS